MIEVRIVKPEDDLEKLSDEIDDASWGEINEIDGCEIDSLKIFLQKEDNFLIAAYLDGDFAGTITGRLMHNMREDFKWLYIDEVDTVTNHRKKGVATAMMNKSFELAEELNCKEIYLGADHGNHPAHELYKSLKPSDTEEVTGYTWKINE